MPIRISTAALQLIQGKVAATGCSRDTRHQAMDVKFKPNVGNASRSMTNTCVTVRVAGACRPVVLLVEAATRVRPRGCWSTCTNVHTPHSYTTQTTAARAQQHQHVSALCHDVTLDIMTHQWISVDIHSALVLYGGDCGWPQVARRTAPLSTG